MFCLAALIVSPVALGQGFGSDLEAQETIRRQEQVRNADELLTEGREAYANGNFEEAHQKYSSAIEILPFGTATADRRRVLQAHLNDGALALSQTYRRTGKYNEARDLLTDVQEKDPGNFMAEKHLKYLDDPIRTNPALDYQHTTNVDKVRRGLYTGEGYYDLGRYDDAEAEFKDVLRIDPYNKAARRWLERCAAIKSDYYRSAYDHTRAEMLSQVDKAWELAVPPVGIVNQTTGITQEVNQGKRSITAKLQNIRIDRVSLNNETVENAVNFLRARSRDLDPEGVGINFVVRTPRVVDEAGIDAGDGGELGSDGLGGGDPGAQIINSLELTDVPLIFVLQQIADDAGLRFVVDEFAVTLIDKDDDSSAQVSQRSWTVPPTFSSFLDTASGDASVSADSDPFGGGGAEATGIKPRRSIQELLESAGVSFGPGSSASLLPATNSLIVRNTAQNLDLIDSIVKDAANQTPRQILVTTKFVEISQENTEELGFDWIATPFGLGNDTFLGGGSVGNGAVRTNADFIGTVDGVTFNGIPAGQNQNVTGIVTAGARSGSAAISQNSIDSILNNPQRTAEANSVAPGILSLTGLFDGGQIQTILRGLSQKKGTDIMTAPSVVASPGKVATIEIIREFIYPTEYEPPELPNTVGGGGGGFGGGILGFPGGGGGGGGFPVTPATPSAFDTKNTGVTLEVNASIDQNDSLIELRFKPTIVEFEGFVNYGSPITAPSTDGLGNPVQVVITENRIEMPVFSVRKVETQITIFDGYTVAVGGLMREDVQNVEDKVPILGDLPFIGRLFQTKAENHIKSNLIIFVTAEIIDATGRRVNAVNQNTVTDNTGAAFADEGFGAFPTINTK